MQTNKNTVNNIKNIPELVGAARRVSSTPAVVVSCPPLRRDGLQVRKGVLNKRHPRVPLSGISILFTTRGFTLIELLVVVLIIAILAAVALPQYQKAVEKSRITQALTFLNAVYKSHQLCVLQHGENSCFLGDKSVLARMDIELPGEIETSNCVSDTVCIKTKDWEFGTDDATMFIAYRMQNEELTYSISIQLTNDDNNMGKITCGGDFCTSLCGDDVCYLN